MLTASHVLVFGWHSPGAAALASALTSEGIPAWAASRPSVATRLVVEHPEIHWVVTECTSSTISFCRQLKANRPDVEIVGIQADGRMAPRSGCNIGCTLCPASRVETLTSFLKGLVETFASFLKGLA